jgi:NADPH-dependent 2,4-dienoyl-CoA reductase/sulfur reductase-like enzyme
MAERKGETSRLRLPSERLDHGQAGGDVFRDPNDYDNRVQCGMRLDLVADVVREISPMVEFPFRKVVIVGAGFGGIEAAKSLRRAPVEVTVIDRQNHHCFQPLLYQVATAALSPADVAWPIRHILRKQKNATVLMAEVRAIDTSTSFHRKRPL